MQIYIKPRHEPQKEISLSEANRLLKSGVLDGEELAWTAGLSDWTVLKMIKGIERPTPPPLPVSVARKIIDSSKNRSSEKKTVPPPLPRAINRKSESVANNRSYEDKNEVPTIKPEVPNRNPKTVEKQVVNELNDCPKCGLLNPPNALKCDCGYSFETHSQDTNYQSVPLDKYIKRVINAGKLSILYGWVKILMSPFAIILKFALDRDYPGLTDNLKLVSYSDCMSSESSGHICLIAKNWFA